MRTVAFCEIDPYCRTVLAKHWPDVPCYDDVRTLPRLGNIDVVCGGFPCQPFSHAGKQLGAQDDRHLWPAMREVIRRERPAWVIGENVAGLINMGLDAVLSDLEEDRYAVRAFDIPACAVDAPHIRRRIWILAGDRDRDRDRESALPLDAEVERVSGNVADTLGTRLQGHAGHGEEAPRRSRPQRGPVAAGGLSDGEDPPRRWNPEPDVGRVAHGIPARMDRLRALGNAVVPDIPEIIGRAIMSRVA